jgi:hypothetical protein
MSSENLDFDEEGRKLRASLNLSDVTPTSSRYQRLNAIWAHPTTQAVIYVGDETAARDLKGLQGLGIGGVVNCTDNIDNFHERGGEVDYLRFLISFHFRHLTTNPESVIKFFAPLFAFITGQLAAGRSVLIHCLAGAHRAGTTGVASLMYYGGITQYVKATAAAKQMRSIINPIGMLPEALARLEKVLQTGLIKPFEVADAGM